MTLVNVFSHGLPPRAVIVHFGSQEIYSNTYTDVSPSRHFVGTCAVHILLFSLKTAFYNALVGVLFQRHLHL